MQLHDILLLRTSASLHSVSVGAKPLSTGQWFCALPEAISAGGLTPTTDTSLFLTTYKSGVISQLIFFKCSNNPVQPSSTSS